jgi:hypothetical protein
VDSDLAHQLASDWIARHSARTETVLAAHSWMAKEVEGLLSDEALAASAWADGVPAVIALDGDRLCWLTLKNADAKIATNFGSLPLAGLAIEIAAVLKARGPGIVRSREWRLSGAARAVTIATEEMLGGPLSPDTRISPAEQLLREVARHCGQPIPETGAS